MRHVRLPGIVPHVCKLVFHEDTEVQSAAVRAVEALTRRNPRNWREVSDKIDLRTQSPGPGI
jgi:hypothetical protein